MKYLQIQFLAFLLIAGCSTTSYVEPVSGSVAKVRFSSDSDQITIVRSYEDKKCGGEQELMRLRNGFLFNSSPKALGIPLSDAMHENSFKEFYMKSNTELLFMFYGEKSVGSRKYSCGVPVKAKFNKDNMYEVDFKYGLTKCSVDVNKITKVQNGQYQRKTINTFTNKLDGFGDQCMKVFKRSRLY